LVITFVALPPARKKRRVKVGAAVCPPGAAGHRDDRDLTRGAPDIFDDLVAAFPGHVHIAKHEIELLFSESTNALLPVSGGHDFLAARTKHRFDGLANISVDNKYTGHGLPPQQ
jgi:hypothetical protein